MHMRKLMTMAAMALTLGACAGEPTGVKQAPPATARKTVTALSVDITGPNVMSALSAQNGCYWYADVHGGTAPYTYSWAVPNGWHYSYGSYILGYPTTSGDVEVWVTDANQNTAYTAYPITLTRSGAAC
ncbi:MAG TPA: hypothetical protein VFH27_11530 [Longimicrobiaceae bacterium]|nr:hypothetical protein [Longimicrobiaceae bacterium]